MSMRTVHNPDNPTLRTLNAREADRRSITQDTARYLADGNEITTCDTYSAQDQINALKARKNLTKSTRNNMIKLIEKRMEKS